MTAPEIRMVCMEEKIIIEFQKILKAVNKRILLQYDTTFNLTSFYVSILVMIHPFLVNATTKTSPPIPIAEFFHERKTELTHDEFWRFNYQNFPEINDKFCTITDCEDSFRNSIKKLFSNMPLCWNHL